MGDQFEKFIQENRDHFDEQVSSEQLWNRIERDLEKKSPKSWGWMWKAAAVLLLLSTIYLTVDKFNKGDEASFNTIAYADFQKAEAFYTMQISEKRQLIDEIVSDDLREEFSGDLQKLDGMYDDLKLTFDQTTADTKIVDAMISNLQMRIDILNQQLTILKRLNDNENEQDESVEI